MKIALAALFLVSAFLTMAAPSVSAQEVLTNDSIIQMVRAGLPESVIVAKIRSSQANFDVRTETLIALKQAGVSDRVIEAMVGQTSAAGPAVAKPGEGTASVADTRLRDRDVIYHLNGDRYVELVPILGEIKTEAFPFVVKSELVLKGRRAGYRVVGPQPVFLSAYGPTDAVLVQLDPGTKKDDRNLKVGGGGGYFAISVRHGVREKDRIEVVSERNEQGLYRISPRKPLPAGEYGFVVIGASAGMPAKVFDFGVD